MATNKNIAVVVAAVLLLVSAQSAFGGFSIRASFGSKCFSHRSFGHHKSFSRFHGHGFFIGPRTYRHHCVSPFHRKVIVVGRSHPRFIRICPPRPNVVISSPPIVVEHSIPAPVQQSNKVTVWFTNTNGSKSSVELTRSGPGYIGPRGEYYKTMPTDEQLRMVYGF